MRPEWVIREPLAKMTTGDLMGIKLGYQADKFIIILPNY